MANSETGDPIAGISSIATRHVLLELGEIYERKSGQRVTVESVGGVDAARRVQEGGAFDFIVLAAEAIDKLASATLPGRAAFISRACSSAGGSRRRSRRASCKHHLVFRSARSSLGAM